MLFSFFHFFKLLSFCPLLDLLPFLYPFSLLILEVNGSYFHLFCGYLVNFNLNTYQSLKLITILTLLLNNARTLELESQSFIPLASFSYMYNPTNCHSHRHYHPYLYSQCLPTLSPLSLLFLTFISQSFHLGSLFLIKVCWWQIVFLFLRKYIYFVLICKSFCCV